MLKPSDLTFQSTRPLRGATMAECIERETFLFQSTRPLRGATGSAAAIHCGAGISIHAPLAGRDSTPPSAARPRRYFNPRAPCGARLCAVTITRCWRQISIHAPLAGRDAVGLELVADGAISIHAPLAGRDYAPKVAVSYIIDISIHAPLAGRDSKFDEFLSANLHKSNKRDLLSEEKMRHGLPRTTCMSHFRSFLGAKLQRFSARLPFALRS